MKFPSFPGRASARPWFQWLEPLPLFGFLVYIRLLPPLVRADWLAPYALCTLLSAAVLAVGVQKRQPLNRIYLAISLYFLSGLLGLLLPWDWLNTLYGKLEATAMLGWVPVVGVASLMLSSAGFLGIPAPVGAVRRSSFWLLAASAAALVFSARTHGALWSAFVPFFFLFTVQARLRARLLALGAATP